MIIFYIYCDNPFCNERMGDCGVECENCNTPNFCNKCQSNGFKHDHNASVDRNISWKPKIFQKCYAYSHQKHYASWYYICPDGKHVCPVCAREYHLGQLKLAFGTYKCADGEAKRERERAEAEIKRLEEQKCWNPECDSTNTLRVKDGSPEGFCSKCMDNGFNIPGMYKNPSLKAGRRRFKNVDATECTFPETETKFYAQYWYNCDTCFNNNNGAGHCTVCVEKCKAAGHIPRLRYGGFFCDTGHMLAEEKKNVNICSKCKSRFGYQLAYGMCDTCRTN